MGFHKNSSAYEMLKQLALNLGVLTISLLAPKLAGQLAKSIYRYQRKEQLDKYRLLRDLKRLQQRGLVDIRYLPDKKIKITITKQGKQEVLLHDLENLKLEKPKQWDKKWRLVIFDIPDEDKKARDALRRKLRQLDFYPLQESVFITPYPCAEEIDFIATVFEVRDCVLLMEVSGFEGEDKFKKYFEI